MSLPSLLVSPSALTSLLFKFSEARHKTAHERFIQDMVIGILGSQSTVVANVARFLGESQPLQATENRLCRMLNNECVEWDDLRMRTLELNSRLVKNDDIIAFDPGDITKDYAEKMENIYRVHDGSKNQIGNGFEDFSAEAIQWRNGKRYHVPLYEKLITAKCDDYISQNRQIIDGIRAIQICVGTRGIWVLDRGHDRTVIFEKALLRLPIRWVVRAKENRLVRPEDKSLLRNGEERIGLMDLVARMKLSEDTFRLLAPKKSGNIQYARTTITFEFDNNETPIGLVIVKDVRNQSPVVLLTNMHIGDDFSSHMVFAYYLERWGKEEGYRFIKSFLNSENIRTHNWRSTQSLAFLAFLTYSFITLFYRSSPERIDAMAEERLKHFNAGDTVTFKYYRIGQLMRLLIAEQTGRLRLLPLMTEVG